MTARSVCAAVFDVYNTFPRTSLPEKNEWTALAAFSLVKGEEIKVVAAATGTKCIGSHLLEPTGHLLVDSHAEVLAARSFRRWLFHEIRLGRDSSYLSMSSDGSYQLREGTDVWFCCTQTPCGDASIFNVSDLPLTLTPIQEGKRSCVEDIQRTGAKVVGSSANDMELQGTSYHTVGAYRRKPGRGIPSRSMSCSDKLAKWNIVGIQGSLASIFVEPIYISHVVIGDLFDESALQRALYTRVRNVVSSGVYVNRPTLESFPPEFIFPCGKLDRIRRRGTGHVKACNKCVNWNEVDGSIEVTLGSCGRKMSVGQKKAKEIRFMSRISKYLIGREFLETALTVKGDVYINQCRNSCDGKLLYSVCKATVKEASKLYDALPFENHWIRTGMDDFSIE